MQIIISTIYDFLTPAIAKSDSDSASFISLREYLLRPPKTLGQYNENLKHHRDAVIVTGVNLRRRVCQIFESSPPQIVKFVALNGKYTT